MLEKQKTCALLISTYNWPAALRLVLESVKKQTRLPDEVIIADDGSGDATRKLIEDFQKDFPCPLIHVWHEDNGFRRCTILNLAITRAKSDYLVQIDGDCVLSRRFIEDHIAFAESNAFTCGSRTLLTQESTNRLISKTPHGTPPRISPASQGVQNKFNALRIPALWNVFRFRYRSHKPYISKGCNMGFWKKDLLAINGYNETISGWGREDSELEVRLMKLGIRRQTLKFGAVQYHLFHKESDRSHDVKNIETLNRTIASSDYRIPNGIVKE